MCGSPDPATGRVPAASIIPDCVPLNLFGGAGSITEEQLAYVIPGTMTNRGKNEQRYAELVLSGPGGRILGRDVQWVLGAEYRREAGSLVPDPLTRLVDDRGLRDLFRTTPEVSGAYDAHELFTAVQVPLAARSALGPGHGPEHRPALVGLLLLRQHTTWQAGLRWQLAEELTLRANYGEVLRAPSLAELYEPPVYVEQFALDPCGNDPTPTQRANCAANGVPGGAYVQDGWGAIAVYGGNPELEPETGHTLGAGLVYTPVWANGLSASVDYFQANLLQPHLSLVSRRDHVRVRGAWRVACAMR